MPGAGWRTVIFACCGVYAASDESVVGVYDILMKVGDGQRVKSEGDRLMMVW